MLPISLFTFIGKKRMHHALLVLKSQVFRHMPHGLEIWKHAWHLERGDLAERRSELEAEVGAASLVSAHRRQKRLRGLAQFGKRWEGGARRAAVLYAVQDVAIDAEAPARHPAPVRRTARAVDQERVRRHHACRNGAKVLPQGAMRRPGLVERR